MPRPEDSFSTPDQLQTSALFFFAHVLERPTDIRSTNDMALHIRNGGMGLRLITTQRLRELAEYAKAGLDSVVEAHESNSNGLVRK